MSFYRCQQAKRAGGLYTRVYVDSLVHRYTSCICSRVEHSRGTRFSGTVVSMNMLDGHKCQNTTVTNAKNTGAVLTWCCTSPSMRTSAFRGRWGDSPSVLKWEIHHSLEINLSLQNNAWGHFRYTHRDAAMLGKMGSVHMPKKLNNCDVSNSWKILGSTEEVTCAVASISLGAVVKKKTYLESLAIADGGWVGLFAWTISCLIAFTWNILAL